MRVRTNRPILALPVERSVVGRPPVQRGSASQPCRVPGEQSSAQPGNGNEKCREGSVALQCGVRGEGAGGEKALQQETATCCSTRGYLRLGATRRILLKQGIDEDVRLRWGRQGRQEERGMRQTPFLWLWKSRGATQLSARSVSAPKWCRHRAGSLLQAAARLPLLLSQGFSDEVWQLPRGVRVPRPPAAARPG